MKRALYFCIWWGSLCFFLAILSIPGETEMNPKVGGALGLLGFIFAAIVAVGGAWGAQVFWDECMAEDSDASN